MSLLEISLIATLAVYRLTLLINGESGPAEIFSRMRTKLGVRYDQYSNPISTGWLSEGILCFFCLSVWIGIAASLLLAFMAVFWHFGIGVFFFFSFCILCGGVFFKKRGMGYRF